MRQYSSLFLTLFVSIGIFFILALFYPRFVLAANCQSDLDNNNLVEIQDLIIMLQNWSNHSTSELLTLLGLLGNSCPASTSTPPNAATLSSEWSQHAHDSANTSWAPDTVATPWKYKWQWNGAGSDGKKQASHLSVPKQVQPVTGGGRIYMVAGNQIYALNKTSGAVIWSKGSLGTLESTPAYGSESVYVASTNGSLYRLNASTGAIQNTFSGSGAFRVPPALANNTVWIGNDTGQVYALNGSNLAKQWEYAAGSPIETKAAYTTSPSAIVVVNSQDLTVHAINANTGSRIWAKKPSPRTYKAGTTEFKNSWPVIAVQHGIVFVRLKLDWETLWTWNPFPMTNSEIRSALSSKPDQQAIFALRLSDGATAFIPNIGNGGAGDGGSLPMGPQPVIARLDNQEVAYTIWRSGQVCGCATAGNCNGQWCDGREDATVGEMVLDNSTISGYQAGDIRFVKFIDIQTDEMMNLTMAQDMVFHSHWLINAGVKITNRSASYGSTFKNPIQTSNVPHVIWRQVYCPAGNSQCNPIMYPGGSGNTYGPSNCPFNATTRYCSAGLYSYGDQRSYPPGFYEYHNDSNGGSSGYTVISAGQVLVKTYDGGLMVFENGNPGASTVQSLKVAGVSTSNGGSSEPEVIDIDYTQAKSYLGKRVRITGTIVTVENHRPKAVYLSFTPNYKDSLWLRIFEKDIEKLGLDPMTLKGKYIIVTGAISLYWPDNKYPELIIEDPTQLQVSE